MSSIHTLIRLTDGASICSMFVQFIYLFMYFLSFFIIAVVQLLCAIVCRASVNKDVYNSQVSGHGSQVLDYEFIIIERFHTHQQQCFLTPNHFTVSSKMAST